MGDRHNVPTVTGVIYVVIIALWAAVLIPIWLRRHDQISEVRSTARFSSAMKTLGGRGNLQYASGHDDYDMHDSFPTSSHQTNRSTASRSTASRSTTNQRRAEARRPDAEARMMRDEGSRSVQRRDVPETRHLEREGLDPTYERELIRRAAATRRAMVLGSLTALLLVGLLLAIIGVLPRWVPILTAVPVVAFVLATALTASSRSTARPQERRRHADRPVPQRRADVVEEAQVDDWESWNAWDDDESWDALPTTLPTYVSAPRATAVPRGIDKAHEGEWTGEAMVETARTMRHRPMSAPLADAGEIDFSAETTEIPAVTYDDRRAANQ